MTKDHDEESLTPPVRLDKHGRVESIHIDRKRMPSGPKRPKGDFFKTLLGNFRKIVKNSRELLASSRKPQEQPKPPRPRPKPAPKNLKTAKTQTKETPKPDEKPNTGKDIKEPAKKAHQEKKEEEAGAPEKPDANPPKTPETPEVSPSPNNETKIPPAEKEDKAPEQEETGTQQGPVYSNRIFVAHGDNERMKQKVVPVLKKLGFDPVLFHKDRPEGQTLDQYAQAHKDVGFAVILLSIEDFGYHKDQQYRDARVRTSQQVVFELGFLLARLGRQRVFVLYPKKDNFELPTDYLDVYFTPYDSEHRWKLYLLDRLRSCGYEPPENTAI